MLYDSVAFCVVDFILILPNWDSCNSNRQTEYFTEIISRLLGLDKFIFRPKLSSLITTFVVVLKTLECDRKLRVVVGEMPGWMSFKVIGKDRWVTSWKPSANHALQWKITQLNHAGLKFLHVYRLLSAFLAFTLNYNRSICPLLKLDLLLDTQM